MTKLSILSLCAVLALAACGGGEKAASDKPADSTATTSTAPAEPAKAGGDPALDKEIDAGLAQVKGQLPMKLGDTMEMTSMERKGTDIVYTYTFLTDAVKKDNFKLEDGKKAGAQQLCANAETKKYLDAGYSFNFNYKFKDGSNLEVPFKAGDC